MHLDAVDIITSGSSIVEVRIWKSQLRRCRVSGVGSSGICIVTKRELWCIRVTGWVVRFLALGLSLEGIRLTELGANELKKSQGGRASSGFVKSNGCVAVEPQDWIDGINHPEWGRTDKQIFGPDTKPYESWISYKFSTF